jgi:hypothetical protein
MTISASAFVEVLRGKSGGQLTLLAEIKHAYQTGAGPAEGTIRLSDRQYRTKSTDTPASVNYRAVIEKLPTFERSIDAKKLGGRGIIQAGPLVLNRTDKSVDFVLDAIIDGRDVTLKAGHVRDPSGLGADTWDYADFGTVNFGLAGIPSAKGNQLTIPVLNRNFGLDRTIVGDTIATGPNTGKPKPILFGYVKNLDITPYLYDASALKYYVNNFTLATTLDYLKDVRDGGVTLITVGFIASVNSGNLTANAGTDTLSYTGHGFAANDVIIFRSSVPPLLSLPSPLQLDTQYWVLSSGLTANDFKLSLTKGGSAIDLTTATVTNSGFADRRRFYFDTAAATIELSSSPTGRVTLDIEAEPSVGLGYLTADPFGAFRYVLESFSGMAASEYDLAGIMALYGSGFRYGRAVLDRTNILDVLDEIAACTASWYSQNSAGVLTVGKLALATLDSATSIDTITEIDIVGDLSCENLPLEHGRLVLDADKNSAVQTDGLAAAVTAANRAAWGQQFQTRVTTTDPAGVTYPDNWWDYHKSVSDSAPMQTPLAAYPASTTYPQAACDEITTLFKPWTRLYSCTVGLDKYALNPGDCVTLTYSAFGLNAGAKVRVLSVSVDFTARAVALVMVRQVTPDYTTMDFN